MLEWTNKKIIKDRDSYFGYMLSRPTTIYIYEKWLLLCTCRLKLPMSCYSRKMLIRNIVPPTPTRLHFFPTMWRASTQKKPMCKARDIHTWWLAARFMLILEVRVLARGEVRKMIWATIIASIIDCWRRRKYNHARKNHHLRIEKRREFGACSSWSPSWSRRMHAHAIPTRYASAALALYLLHVLCHSLLLVLLH